MQIDVSTGLIPSARLHPSPNCDERPTQVIDLLVIHGISLPPGEFGGDDVFALFTNQLDSTKHEYFKQIAHLKVSSHLFIRRSGELWQFVPFTMRAWHAGPSIFAGRTDCNNFSIGIELEGTDQSAYTNEQYHQLAQVTSSIMQAYPITMDHIVGHCDIAPSRKTDPGPFFDWQHYKQLIIKLLANKQNSQKTDIIR